MKKYYFVGMVLILLMAVGLISYGVYLNKSDESQIAMRMENRTVPLQGAKAKYGILRPVFYLATVNLTSNAKADAIALIDGRIESVYIDKNSRVAKGQVLFELVNEDIPLKIKQADSEIAKAEAQLLNAKNSFARYERLKSKNATTLEKYDEAKLNYEAAQANLQQAEAQKAQLLVQDSRKSVTAPIDGEVLIVYKQIGAFVRAGTPLALVGDFSLLSFSIPVEDAAAKKLSAGEHFEMNFKSSRNFQKAYGTEYGVGNRGNDQTFPVVLKEIMPDMSQAADMRKMIFEIDNSTGILEQRAYNDVELVRTMTERALLVPLGAVNDGAEKFVFIVRDDNTLEKRIVTVGADDGKSIEILGGVLEGETVAISAGIKGLESGMKVTVSYIGGES